MRVCIEKLTGKLIESQSGGEVDRLPQTVEMTDEEYVQYLTACDNLEFGRLNTLIQNAINAGYDEADIEAKYVTDAEFAVIMEANKPVPTYADLRRAEYPSIEEINVALWELVVEGRPEAADALQIKRLKVKERIPKT